MTSSILVTGGAGFIGCALSHAASDLSDRWVVMDNLHPQVHVDRHRPDALHRGAELRLLDVVRPEDWDSLLTDLRPDVVVHLAAETGTAQSLDESSRHGLVNVIGTTQMLDAFTRVEHVPSHFILTSSRAVYGEGLWQRADGTTFTPGLRTKAQLESGEWDHGSDASHLPNAVGATHPNPVNVYGATKLAQEHILSSWAGSRDTKVSILRLQNVYGPGQSLSNPYTGIVSLFSRLAREGQSIPLYEDGEITRDFVYISDVVAALRTAITAPPSGPLRTVDVGTGVRTTIRDLASSVAAFHGAPAPHVTGQFRNGDVRHAACAKINGTPEFDWSPQWDNERGIAELQGWIASELDD